ncbi:MAG: hypothetical protein ACYTF1_27475, partial [Planctomycetota bacterium]
GRVMAAVVPAMTFPRNLRREILLCVSINYLPQCILIGGLLYTKRVFRENEIYRFYSRVRYLELTAYLDLPSKRGLATISGDEYLT